MAVLYALLEGCETTFSRKDFGKIGLAWKQPKPNPIEILREIINSKVADKQPSTAGGLNQVIKDIWVKESSKDCSEKLICNKPRGTQAIIKSKGGRRNY